MCKNGSLAEYTGFDVDIECALTTIVDGEVLVARNNKKTAGIINALNSFDKYFQNDPDFKIFNIFAGKTDLLFKVSKAIRIAFICSINSFRNLCLVFLFRIHRSVWWHVMKRF